MLKTARAVIIDEIHAVLQSRRGAHLALSLERLDHVCGRRLQRIGLSATQKPIEEVARFLDGCSGRSPAIALSERDGNEKGIAIVDRCQRRRLDLALALPASPLEAVIA